MCSRVANSQYIKVLNSTWKTIRSPFHLNIKWKADRSESFQGKLAELRTPKARHPQLRKIVHLFGGFSSFLKYLWVHLWSHKRTGSSGQTRTTFLPSDFADSLEKNVVIYRDINYAKQPTYKREDIDRALLHGIVKMPASDIMSYCVYIL